MSALNNFTIMVPMKFRTKEDSDEGAADKRCISTIKAVKMTTNKVESNNVFAGNHWAQKASMMTLSRLDPVNKMFFIFFGAI